MFKQLSDSEVILAVVTKKARPIFPSDCPSRCVCVGGGVCLYVCVAVCVTACVYFVCVGGCVGGWGVLAHPHTPQPPGCVHVCGCLVGGGVLAHTHTNTHIHTHTSCEYYSRVRKLVCKCVCVCGVGSVLVRVYAEVSSKLLIVRAFLAYLSCCHLPLPPGTWL